MPAHDLDVPQLRLVNRFLRTAPTRRLLAVIAGVVVVIAAGTAIALAATGAGPVPRARPLAQAIRDALGARSVQGVSATISFTNHLIDSSNIQGTDPLLNGATGRMWASNDGRLRLELQGDNGDAQLVVNKASWWISDPTSSTVYEGKLPSGSSGHKQAGGAEKLPTISAIQTELSNLMTHMNVSGAVPGDIAGQAEYTVTVSPKHAGGLLGSIQLAWDAVHRVPLEFAVYARGDSSPVLSLSASGVSYGPVSLSVFKISPPAGDHVVTVSSPTGTGTNTGKFKSHGRHAAVAGVAAVARRLPFALAAPPRLAGMARQSVTLLDFSGHPGALVTYGKGLGGIAVIEQLGHGASVGGAGSSGGGEGQGLTIPTISVHGVTAQQLPTALGTVVSFARDGVSYTVLGSVGSGTADRAARGL